MASEVFEGSEDSKTVDAEPPETSQKSRQAAGAEIYERPLLGLVVDIIYMKKPQNSFDSVVNKFRCTSIS